MLSFVMIAVCVGLSSAAFSLPHGHDLKTLVDNSFKMLDRNNNGFISESELAFISDGEDADHDGNVTLAEYMEYFKIPIEVAQPIFNAYDTDNDGMLQTAYLHDLHLLDHDGDGQVNLKEWEHYETGFLQCVFEHGTHGHGADCSHR